ncbi:ABC transporter substrate-binding protein [Bordetella sp. FB-8]|uniref:ABC transporter substrate-binding protein n=1 Tax=Bordetella sp. FB-8 TaxID=1159870 RepID=UPI00035D94B1|nr:ABC transporter substrate-binding protein [Bordetella sp. FB-8]
MFKIKHAKCSRSFKGAVLFAALSLYWSGASWAAPAASPATQAAGATPGITESGLNVWTVRSTPLTASIAVDRKAHDALAQAIKDKGFLSIGVITDEPPFIFTPNGKLQGVDVDMVGGLARALGIKIRLEKTSFDAMIPGLQSGRFDVAMGDFTDTSAREKVVDFVDYLGNGQTVITRKGETRDFSKPLDLCGFSVSAPKGSLSAKLMTELSDICTGKGLKPIDIKTFPGSAPGILALEIGRVDAVPVTYAIATYLVKLHPDKYTLTDNLFYRSYKGAAILKGQKALLNALTFAFQAVVSSPNYNQIMAHWNLGKVKIDKVYVNVPGEPLNKSIK